MKEIIITPSNVVGYKKPALWVVEGNKWENVASFNSEEAKELFVQAIKKIVSREVDKNDD